MKFSTIIAFIATVIAFVSTNKVIGLFSSQIPGIESIGGLWLISLIVSLAIAVTVYGMKTGTQLLVIIGIIVLNSQL